ncbi:MAG: DUF58 domain-containing protein [Thermoguttaceae bacterium]
MFDSSLIRKFEYLALVSRCLLRGRLLKRRFSRTKHGGVEFADYRQYVLGDDLRYLDWNLLARHETKLLKQFVDEDDLRIYFVLDCSASMSVGAKFELVKKITAALAYIALDSMDRVSVRTFTDRIESISPTIQGKKHAFELFRFLDRLEPISAQTDLLKMVQYFLHQMNRPGLVVILSDFFTDPLVFSLAMKLLQFEGNEVHVIQVYAPEERSPDLLGEIELCDMESGETVNEYIDYQYLSQYAKQFTSFLDKIAKECIKSGIRCTATSSDVSFDDFILQMIRKRGTEKFASAFGEPPA